MDSETGSHSFTYLTLDTLSDCIIINYLIYCVTLTQQFLFCPLQVYTCTSFNYVCLSIAYVAYTQLRTILSAHSNGICVVYYRALHK